MTGRTVSRGAAFDAALAVALAALSAWLLAAFATLPWPAFPLALAHTLPLTARRSAPVAAGAVATAAAFGYLSLGFPMVGLGPTALVWLYAFGSYARRPESYLLLAAAQVAVAVGVARGQGDVSTLVGDIVALLVAYLLGDSARRRRDVIALHRDRADQLERTQAEVARRAVAEERLRIARELHDVVAHSMSVVAVQAGTGRLVVDRDPAAAREALTVIERTSRDALDEMRRLLGVLRDEDGGSGRAPAPDLAGLDELIARTVASGVPVSVRVEGERRPLPAGLELAAYRIVQEALTNVARHAPGAAATVVLRYGPDGLGVEVTNTRGGAAPSPNGSGHGLLGMRERAAVYGGTVEAGPLPGGGYRVATELRTEAAR
ncbi:MAG TPA: sensor histidine kinase [Frankiaceae bacterium]|nr:sensor histidine kinase [Frankiaceae bacterium]